MGVKKQVIEEKDELSSIHVGGDFDLSVFQGITEKSPFYQKKAASREVLKYKEDMFQLSFEMLKKETQLRDVLKKLNETDLMKGIRQLRKEIKAGKKMVEDMAAQYNGAIKMTKQLGVPLEPETIKQLTEKNRCEYRKDLESKKTSK